MQSLNETYFKNPVGKRSLLQPSSSILALFSASTNTYLPWLYHHSSCLKMNTHSSKLIAGKFIPQLNKELPTKTKLQNFRKVKEKKITATGIWGKEKWFRSANCLTKWRNTLKMKYMTTLRSTNRRSGATRTTIYRHNIIHVNNTMLFLPPTGTFILTQNTIHTQILSWSNIAFGHHTFYLRKETANWIFFSPFKLKLIFFGEKQAGFFSPAAGKGDSRIYLEDLRILTKLSEEFFFSSKMFAYVCEGVCICSDFAWHLTFTLQNLNISDMLHLWMIFTFLVIYAVYKSWRTWQQ